MNHYIEDIFVYLPTIISTYLIYNMIIQLKINVFKIIYYTISTFFIVGIILIIQDFNQILSRILLIVLITMSIYIFDRSMKISSIPLSIITIGLSYCFRMLGIIITSLISWIFHYDKLDIYISISIAIVQLLSTLLFINFKRFKYGIKFFKNKSNLGIGLFLSGFLFIVICTINQKFVSEYLSAILSIGVFISLVGLVLWIRKSITDHYRKKLQAKADEHYQNTLNEKEQQIEQLNSSNAFLSKVVHRDNHLMSALQHTISEYKSCDNQVEKEKLLNEILTLAEERNDLIVKEQANSKILPTTGLSIIDGALSNMYIKASAHDIEFNLIVNQDIHYLVNNLITQTDLETLLCDHIKDAIIAITSDDNIKGRILITITLNDDIYEISIKDNGIDFETDTLAKLGQERITTHKETGGSGIGFMTTFETLKKSKASLIITEYKTKTPFSKSITFRFDGLESFIIKSNRADLLRQTINRNDIIIMKN